MPERSRKPGKVHLPAPPGGRSSAGEPASPPTRSAKNPAAVALGRLGGAKGGRARAESRSPEKRHDVAQKAARARWRKWAGGQ